MRIPNRRHRLILDRMQFRLLGFGFLYVGLGLAVLTVFLFAPAITTLFSPSANLQERETAAGEFLALHGRLWPAAAVVLILFSIHGLFVSHRIAGPLYRFRQVYRAVGQGDFSGPVVLRRHDYLHGDAKALNEMLAGLRGQREHFQRQMAELEGALAALEAMLIPGTQPAELLAQLKETAGAVLSRPGGASPPAPDSQPVA